MAAEEAMIASGTPSLRARVARSMFWITWSRGVLQVLSLATTLVVARILVPADYGVMALATFFTGTAGMVAEMGLGAAIIQFRGLSRREINSCFWITVTLATIACAALAIAAPTIARWFAVPRLAEVLPVLALVLPVTACSVVSDSLLRQRLALDRVSQAEVIAAVVTLPVTLACAFGGLGVWTLVIAALVGPAARSAASFAFAPWRPGFRVGGDRVGDVVHFSLVTISVKIMWSLRETANALILGKITGHATTVGLYSMADELAHLPGSKITPVINMLTAPVMAELQTDIEAMRAAFYRAMRLTVAIVVPTSAGIALVADEIVAVLLGPKWSAAVPLLRLLCVFAAIRAIDVLLPPVLFARRRERYLFWYCLALLIVMPAAAVLGALWDGASGMVICYTPAYCAVMLFMAREALAELKGGFSELWSQIWAILAAAAAMAAVVLMLRELALVEGLESAVIRLVFLSVSGAVIYGAVLFALGSPVIAEGIEVAGWILRRHRAKT